MHIHCYSTVYNNIQTVEKTSGFIVSLNLHQIKDWDASEEKERKGDWPFSSINARPKLLLVRKCCNVSVIKLILSLKKYKKPFGYALKYWITTIKH